MKKDHNSPLGLYTIGIAALFLAGFLLLVLFGARSYQNTVAGQEDNYRLRDLTAYFWTVVKAGDMEDAVSVEDSEYGPCLSIADIENESVLRIYAKDGVLMEEYSSPDLEIDPESSEEIAETSVFEPELSDGGLLKIRTDAGTVLISLRAGGK